MKRKLTGDENLHRGSAVVPLPFNENTAQVTHSSKKSKIEVALYPSPPAVLTLSVTVRLVLYPFHRVLSLAADVVRSLIRPTPLPTASNHHLPKRSP